MSGAIPVFINGGDPIGTLPGDSLTINLAAPAAVTADPGPESDEGAFTVGANAPVSYDKIESATVNGVSPGSNSPFGICQTPASRRA